MTTSSSSKALLNHKKNKMENRNLQKKGQKKKNHETLQQFQNIHRTDAHSSDKSLQKNNHTSIVNRTREIDL